jgi:starch phosphorylase
MEFGLGESLPLYAGGLGVLAGDYLKTASDLGVPVVGVGLLYQEGYSRQVLDAAGRPQDLYPV